MCGIAGIMTADARPPDASALEALAAALAHRGPDGAAVALRGDTGLVHTRLAIIDLTGGDQPLYGPRDCALIANGEIYNNPELRASALADAAFKTGSDCEPILHLYERHGMGCADHLRGMFAFAVHDRERESLVLSRDPFGIKPLYYLEAPSFFAFASEPQALAAAGLTVCNPPRDFSEELLQLQFTTRARTAFDGVKRLLPGETLRVRGGKIVERRHRDALPRQARLRVTERAALARADQAIMDSAMVHLRSDVPYGLFLSGGIDSAILLACLSQLSDHPVTAYTASFPGTRLADEFPQAQRVAEAVGARHVNVKITEADFWDHLPSIAACVDDATADYAIVPTYLLAREAARDVKVILCGEGGDELFAGYSRYLRQALPLWLGGRRRRRAGPFSHSGVLIQDPSGWRDGLAAAEAEARSPERSRLQVAQATDCIESMPNALLTKLDRCLMAHGVEGRTPFLDPALGNLGFLLPQRLKLRRGLGKYILRRWLEDRLPEAAPFARKKGFTVPVGEWIRASGARLGPLIASDPGVARLCQPEKVLSLYQSRSREDEIAAWRLLFYALWHRRHVRGISPSGDAFVCLADPYGLKATASDPSPRPVPVVSAQRTPAASPASS